MLGFLSRAAESSSTSAEERLIARCKAGDMQAFDEIVAAYQDKIFNLCRWNLGDADLAADAAQDVFVRAWRAIGRFRGEASLSTWLHRIALNVITDTGQAACAWAAVVFLIRNH
jgi:RNA polymerase sigma-70 factor (ECF subfamily)